ncbi:MAG: hypothetical protein MK020_07160, partial [Dehalococcoidia bacterium]|nr:hypothetical protein [Dehalococcoidia bacterium]
PLAVDAGPGGAAGQPGPDGQPGQPGPDGQPGQGFDAKEFFFGGGKDAEAGQSDGQPSSDSNDESQPDVTPPENVVGGFVNPNEQTAPSEAPPSAGGFVAPTSGPAPENVEGVAPENISGGFVNPTNQQGSASSPSKPKPNTSGFFGGTGNSGGSQ